MHILPRDLVLAIADEVEHRWQQDPDNRPLYELHRSLESARIDRYNVALTVDDTEE